MSRKPLPRPRALNERLLPPQLRVLVRVLGESDALRLVEHCGGTPLIVPTRPRPDHWLAEVISWQALVALVAECAGITMELPKYDSVLRQWRHQRVHELSRHMSDAEVARATGYTRRQVINIRQSEAAARNDGPMRIAPQMDLFGQPGDEPDMPGEDQAPTPHDPFGLGRVRG